MEEMKISVVMSCYNSERFLRQSIDSILMQSYREFEFIIWNDGSTDSTEEIIKSYHDERIRYFYAPNQGLGSALAAACKEARGRYIARMDDDDIAMPNRLDKELAFLELHPDYILASRFKISILTKHSSRMKYITPPLECSVCAGLYRLPYHFSFFCNELT